MKVKNYYGIFVTVVFFCLVCCSCRPSKNKREQVADWLSRCPPTDNPSFWPPEAFTYDSHEEWAQAGRKIEGIEKIIIDLYENHEISVHPHVICVALAFVGSSHSVPLLISVLEDKNHGFHTKLNAVGALGNIGDCAAVGPLCKLVLSDEQPSRKIGSHEMLMLKVNAMAVLGKLGDPNAIPVIEVGLKNPKLSETSKKFVMLYLDRLREK